MDEWIVITEHNWAYWVAGLFALLNFGRYLWSLGEGICEYLFKKKGIKTKKMLEKEAWENRLKEVEKSIEEIKNTSTHNVNMFLEHEQQVIGQFVGMRNEIVTELGKLHTKIDEQKEESDRNNEARMKTDCAMLRDRINSGMRYFSQNVDEEGNVHIAFADYVSLDALFQEYFANCGNGPYEKMYETEFKKFIIER